MRRADLAERDASEEMINYTRSIGLFPFQANPLFALDKMEPLAPTAGLPPRLR